VTYTGLDVSYVTSLLPPTEAGSYTVTATLDNPNVTLPPITDTLVIAKALATLSMTGQAQTYDATPKSVTVATLPADLTGVSVTYDDAATLPTEAGSYIVAVTLDNPDYTADPLSDTLVIAQAVATLTLTDLAQTYDATPRTVSVTTDPADLTGLSVTYDGSPIAPTEAGSYIVVYHPRQPRLCRRSCHRHTGRGQGHGDAQFGRSHGGL